MYNNVNRFLILLHYIVPPSFLLLFPSYHFLKHILFFFKFVEINTKSTNFQFPIF
jgi:hypothetical protein